MASSTYKVLVCVDGSKHSDKALDMAVDLCRRLSTPYLLYVVHVTALNPPSFLPVADQLERIYNLDAEKEGKRMSIEYAERLKLIEDLSYEVDHVKGTDDPRDVICRLCDEKQVNLLVIGSRGLNAISKVILGSVSDYCVRHAHCPVMVVKLESDKHDA